MSSVSCGEKIARRVKLVAYDGLVPETLSLCLFILLPVEIWVYWLRQVLEMLYLYVQI